MAAHKLAERRIVCTEEGFERGDVVALAADVAARSRAAHRRHAVRHRVGPLDRTTRASSLTPNPAFRRRDRTRAYTRLPPVVAFARQQPRSVNATHQSTVGKEAVTCPYASRCSSASAWPSCAAARRAGTRSTTALPALRPWAGTAGTISAAM